jgi:hypothetical protein
VEVISNVNAQRSDVRSIAWLGLLVDEATGFTSNEVSAAAPRTRFLLPAAGHRTVAAWANVDRDSAVKADRFGRSFVPLPRNEGEVASRAKGEETGSSYTALNVLASEAAMSTPERHLGACVS